MSLQTISYVLGSAIIVWIVRSHAAVPCVQWGGGGGEGAGGPVQQLAAVPPPHQEEGPAEGPRPGANQAISLCTGAERSLERSFTYLTVSCWFLISFVFKFTALCMYNLTALFTILLRWGPEGGWGMGPETSHVHKITYGPLIDTVLFVMCLMGANPFLGPLALLELFQGPKKSRLSWSNPANGPCKGFAPIIHIT